MLHIQLESPELFSPSGRVVCGILETACWAVASPGLPGWPVQEVLSWGLGCQQ